MVEDGNAELQLQSGRCRRMNDRNVELQKESFVLPLKQQNQTAITLVQQSIELSVDIFNHFFHLKVVRKPCSGQVWESFVETHEWVELFRVFPKQLAFRRTDPVKNL